MRLILRIVLALFAIPLLIVSAVFAAFVGGELKICHPQCGRFYFAQPAMLVMILFGPIYYFAHVDTIEPNDYLLHSPILCFTPLFLFCIFPNAFLRSFLPKMLSQLKDKKYDYWALCIENFARICMRHVDYDELDGLLDVVVHGCKKDCVGSFHVSDATADNHDLLYSINVSKFLLFLPFGFANKKVDLWLAYGWQCWCFLLFAVVILVSIFASEFSVDLFFLALAVFVSFWYAMDTVMDELMKPIGSYLMLMTQLNELLFTDSSEKTQSSDYKAAIDNIDTSCSRSLKKSLSKAVSNGVKDAPDYDRVIKLELRENAFVWMENWSIIKEKANETIQKTQDGVFGVVLCVLFGLGVIICQIFSMQQTARRQQQWYRLELTDPSTIITVGGLLLLSWLWLEILFKSFMFGKLEKSQVQSLKNQQLRIRHSIARMRLKEMKVDQISHLEESLKAIELIRERIERQGISPELVTVSLDSALVNISKSAVISVVTACVGALL